MVGVSACLLGQKCRYDGSGLYHEKMEEITEKIYPICPEVLAGFSIPRLPCEFLNGDGNSLLLKKGKIITFLKKDITKQMILGAKKAIQACKEQNIKVLYLQQGSPSCGYGWIYDGTFTGNKKEGNGIFTAMALKEGMKIIPLRGIKKKPT